LLTNSVTKQIIWGALRYNNAIVPLLEAEAAQNNKGGYTQERSKA
jgi:hypothetical protein